MLISQDEAKRRVIRKRAARLAKLARKRARVRRLLRALRSLRAYEKDEAEGFSMMCPFCLEESPDHDDACDRV